MACPVCGRTPPIRSGAGRPRTYCSEAHRRLADNGRRRAARSARNTALWQTVLGEQVDVAMLERQLSHR